jgi:hypothetical protein
MSVLQPVGENLWLIDGPVISVYGLPFPTRMAVVRLENGGLWLWSPIQLDDGVRRDIASLGEPRFAVEPNKLHHLALADWVGAWPSLRLYAPPGLAKKRGDLRFSSELTDEPPPEWRGQIDQVRVEGNFFMTEVFFFHRRSSTCLIGDLIQKHDCRSMKRWQRWVLKAAGVAGAEGSTPRDGRLTFIRRDRARQAIARALSWAPRRLVIAHGACAMEGGVDELRRSLHWLLPEQPDRGDVSRR